jgi:peptide/nickel transport system substrate-binding protein
MPRIIRGTVLIILVTALAACTRQSGQQGGGAPVTIAIEGDAGNCNPLFTTEVTANEISELIFPALVSSEFDTSSGRLTFGPMLASSWEERSGGRDLLFHLRTDARWEDGLRVTARDVQFSYELYGDPDVASVRQGSLDGLRKTKQGTIDASQSVEPLDDSTVVFHFEKAYPGMLFDAGLPILPAHVFDTTPRKELRSLPPNARLIGAGPFTLDRWEPMQNLTLRPDSSSVLPKPAALRRLIFRVIPDYQARLAHLKAGEVDIMAGLKPEDARQIAGEKGAVSVVSIPGRRYHFIGWNNIDGEAYGKSGGKTIRAHPLFGSAQVRRALTHAINREEMTKAFLGEYGREAVGPVSPMFRWAYNDTLRPLAFDPRLASSLLAGEGWKDTDGDGILEKRNRKFSFELKVPAGDELRSRVATVVEEQLRAVGIEVRIEQVEKSVFWQDLMQKKYDAWIAGFEVPLQMMLDEFWGSDLEKYPFNLVSFQNKRVDEILAAAEGRVREEETSHLWKEFQSIIQREQPCTFLFWVDTPVGVNKRVQGPSIGVLGITQQAWQWSVEEKNGGPGR